ncbi:SdpA family antimicrobial peptide system protein [Streptomyces sp. MZ04]|uniref:SdpA family antimicrobial peptide system protein n=1 Tax=Streptomyces sp. MZ04 TaxID=2559236 RepID=UPI00107EB14E|nr:SdpA family antimicrobial peptide system protein [Streptomyces sp. MZ04]TGA95545.1 SdpA family antimicrobial peptide system protein [Streptomyces sp. MZ04]
MKRKFRYLYDAFSHHRSDSVAVSPKAIVSIILIWAVAILYAVQEQLPKNVISLPAQKEVKHTVANMAPQGWAFFTKSPRDPEVIPFKRESGNWESKSLTPHAEPRNAFGLNRASRAQGVEIAMLLSAAKQDDWHSCDESRATCLEKFGAAARSIDNKQPNPTLCGTIGLSAERPTPWAWRDLVPETHTPERVLVVEVTC